MAKVLLSWETPEYFPKDRSADWFWAVGIIAAALIITAALLNNVLLAIFLSVATFTIFVYSKQEPEIIKVQISDDVVKSGQNMYPYSTLQSFWIREEGPVPELLLESGSILNPIIIIPINKHRIEAVQAALDGKLPEEETHEPLSQRLLEYLGF